MSSPTWAVVARTICAALLGSLVSACTDSTLVRQPATLDVSSTADSLLSDGHAFVTVSVTLPPSLPQDANVEFTTTLGRWANPGSAPDRKVTVQASGGVAEARLFAAGEVGTAYISGRVAGATAQTTVELTPALPEVIDLFVDRTAAPADGATAVNATAVLRRLIGTVSKGITVRFEVRDSATQTRVAELEGVVVADTTGTARFRFTSTLIDTVQVRAYAATVMSDVRTVRFTRPATVTFRSVARTIRQGGSRYTLPRMEAR